MTSLLVARAFLVEMDDLRGSPVVKRLRESCNSVSTCNIVTETELQLLFIGMINSDRVNNLTSYYALML